MTDANRSGPVLNRAARRANRRRLLAGLRAEGCRCSPRIKRDEVPAANHAESGWVAHEVGCPLGERATVANLAGQWSTFTYDAVGGCGR